MSKPAKGVEHHPLGGAPGLQKQLEQTVDRGKRRVLNRFNDPGYVLTFLGLGAAAFMRPELPQEAAGVVNGVVLSLVRAAQTALYEIEHHEQLALAVSRSAARAEVLSGFVNTLTPLVQFAAAMYTADVTAVGFAAAVLPAVAAHAAPATRTDPPIPGTTLTAKQAAHVRAVQAQTAEVNRITMDQARLQQGHDKFVQSINAARGQAAAARNIEAIQARNAAVQNLAGGAESNIYFWGRLLAGGFVVKATYDESAVRQKQLLFIGTVTFATLDFCYRIGLFQRMRRLLEDAPFFWIMKLVTELFCVLMTAGFAQLAISAAAAQMWPPSLDASAIAGPPTFFGPFMEAAGGATEAAGGATAVVMQLFSRSTKPTLAGDFAEVLDAPIRLLVEVERMFTPDVLATFAAVNFGPFVGPTVVGLRPLDGDPAVRDDDVERATKLLGGANLESRASIHPRSLGVKDSNPMLQTLPGADTYSHPGLVDRALSAVWEQPLINESSGLDAYLFCTKANFEKWTGRGWPFGGFGYPSFPEGAAEGIAINSNAPYTLATPMKFDLAFVQGGSEGNFAAAAEDLVVGIFGSQTKHSSVTEWRWTWTREDPPTTLSQLEDNVQRAVAAGAIYTAPVNTDLFLAPDPRQSHIEKFLNILAVTLATAELYYSMFPAACLNTGAQDVALPPDTGNGMKLDVNILLWTAWERLCSTNLERPGAWTKMETLKAFLSGQTRIRSGETATRHFETLQQILLTDPSGCPLVLSELLNLGPIISAGTGNRGQTLRVCRYYLYLLIPEDKRGLNDASIGGIYSAIIWKGMPGFCPICNKAAATVRWVIDDDGQMINGWVLPPPTSAINDDYNDRRLLLVESDSTKEGCIKCYEEEGIQLIQAARTDDRAAELAVQLATRIRDGDERAEEGQRAFLRGGP